LVRLAIDFEHPGRIWWEAGGQELWDGICEAFESHAVVLDESLAESWLAEARKLPGWGDGPAHAPHPIHTETLAGDDPELA